jgi:beta-lactam-binding protein with PASTA domain
MRTFLRIVWMALVLLIVALVSALTTMRLAIHGREVTVPDFQGKTPVEARRIAEDSGLAVQIEREYFSPLIPRGRILSQMPAAGTVVRRGWELRLALSLGAQRIPIPQVIGESERAATISIQERGLNPASTAGLQFSGVPAGQVIAQNPAPNATDVAAPKLSLLIAEDSPSQAFVMPSFIGQPLGSATITLAKVGFPAPRATLTSYPAPAADSASASITPVAPATSSATPVHSESVTAGPATPTHAGLPSATPAPSSPSLAAIIVSQVPAPGAKVLSGSAITFGVKD